MKGKYLITTDGWFIAPDGQEYRSVWGEISILEDNVLGLKTNRNSTNWYAKIGTERNHVIVAGCQIHYAVRSEDKPSKNCATVVTETGSQYKHPSKIYFTE